jgi:hypothetical protein
MYTQISVELLDNQKVKEAHREAEKYRLLDQAEADGQGSSSFSRWFLSQIFGKPGHQRDNRQIKAKGSAI